MATLNYQASDFGVPKKRGEDFILTTDIIASPNARDEKRDEIKEVMRDAGFDANEYEIVEIRAKNRAGGTQEIEFFIEISGNNPAAVDKAFDMKNVGTRDRDYREYVLSNSTIDFNGNEVTISYESGSADKLAEILNGMGSTNPAGDKFVINSDRIEDALGVYSFGNSDQIAPKEIRGNKEEFYAKKLTAEPDSLEVYTSNEITVTFSTNGVDSEVFNKGIKGFTTISKGDDDQTAVFNGTLKQLKDLTGKISGLTKEDFYDKAVEEIYGKPTLAASGNDFVVETGLSENNPIRADIISRLKGDGVNAKGKVDDLDSAKDLIASGKVTLSEELKASLTENLEATVTGGKTANKLTLTSVPALAQDEDVAKELFGDKATVTVKNNKVTLEFADTAALENFVSDKNISLTNQKAEVASYEREGSKDTVTISLDNSGQSLSADAQKDILEAKKRDIEGFARNWNQDRDGEPRVNVQAEIKKGELVLSVTGPAKALDAFETDFNDKLSAVAKTGEFATKTVDPGVGAKADYVLDDQIQTIGDSKAIIIDGRNGADISLLADTLEKNYGLKLKSGAGEWDYDVVNKSAGGTSATEETLIIRADSVAELNSRLALLKGTGLIDDSASVKLQEQAKSEYTGIDLSKIVDKAETLKNFDAAVKQATDQSTDPNLTVTDIGIKLKSALDTTAKRESATEQLAELLDIRKDRINISDDGKDVVIKDVADQRVKARTSTLEKEFGIEREKVKGNIDLSDDLTVTKPGTKNPEQQYLVVQTADADEFIRSLQAAVKSNEELKSYFRTDKDGKLLGVEKTGNTVEIEVTKNTYRGVVGGLFDSDLLSNDKEDQRGIERNLRKAGALPDVKALKMTDGKVNGNTITFDFAEDVTLQTIERAEATKRFLQAAADAAGIEGGLSPSQVKIDGQGTTLTMELKGMSANETQDIFNKANDIQASVLSSKSKTIGITERKAEEAINKMQTMADGIDAKGFGFGIKLKRNIFTGPSDNNALRTEWGFVGKDKELYADKMQAADIAKAYEYFQDSVKEGQEMQMSGSKIKMGATMAGLAVAAAVLLPVAGLAAAGVGTAAILGGVAVGGIAAGTGISVMGTGIGEIQKWRGRKKENESEENLLKEGKKAEKWAEKIENARSSKSTDRSNDQDLIDRM